MQFVAVEDVLEVPELVRPSGRIGRAGCFLVKRDRTFYECRGPREMLDELQLDWHAFMEYSPESRRVIVEALREMPSGMPLLRYIPEPFDMYFNRMLLERELSQEKAERESES